MATRPRYNVVIPTRYGMMIVNRNDAYSHGADRFGVGHELLETGEFVPAELQAMGQLMGFCAADPVVLDIGANIGVHTLFMSEAIGPGGRIHAFEAQRILFQVLMGNLALNSIENVYGYCAAVGREDGSLKLPPVDYAKPWNFGGMGLVTESPYPQFAHGTPERAAAERNETVPVITLDSLKLERVDFIKLDVEGMEEDVLRGAARTLDVTRPIMQIEWLMRDGGSLPLYLLETLDYRVYQAGMNLLCIPAERADAQVIHGLPQMTAAEVKQAYKLP
jgi:FkbM family methyltransferase